MTYFRLLLLRQQFGTDFTPLVEAAFLNGAMSCFFACQTQDRLPSSWVLGNSPTLDVLAHWKGQGLLNRRRLIGESDPGRGREGQ